MSWGLLPNSALICEPVSAKVLTCASVITRLPESMGTSFTPPLSSNCKAVVSFDEEINWIEPTRWLYTNCSAKRLPSTTRMPTPRLAAM